MWQLALVLSWALVAAALEGRGTQTDHKETALRKQHVGCYNDTSTHDDLPHHIFTSKVLNSPRHCVDLCRLQGFRYAGLQNGADCYCGNNDVRAFGESTSCTKKCPSNEDMTCGGLLANDVYKVSKDSRYLGCYSDDSSEPDLPRRVWAEDDGKSAHECIDECATLGFKYAGVQNGGAGFCGNSFGEHGAANETECDVRCVAWGAENCGGVGKNAVYLTELAYEISKGNIDPTATKLFDEAVTGIPLTLFTFYPRVRTIVTKSLILHSDTEIQTPIDEVTCSKGCYEPCHEINNNDDLINKGKDIHLRFFFLKLSELDKYVGTHARRVWVHAQTVLIDTNIAFKYAVSVRTRQMFINRKTATSISTTDADDLGVDFSGRIKDPEPDLLHYKQSFMCARILYDTQEGRHKINAWAIIAAIASTKSSVPEIDAFAAVVRTYGAELAGLPRAEVHFVPFYTKSHLAKILEAYSERVNIYKMELDKVKDAVKNKKEFISFAKEMHLIYTTTNIAEAEKALEATQDALVKSNATYHRFMDYYDEARINLEVAHENFERALNESRKSSFKNFVRSFKKGVSQIAVGVVRIVLGDVPGGVGNIIGGVDTLFDTMYNLAAAMRQINQLMEIADDILDAINVAEDHNDLMKHLDDIEMMVQLEVNIVRWQNLKNYGEVILEDKEVVEIEGCAEYKRALLDFSNWGEALTRAMVESAELMREAIEKKLLLHIKKQQRERIEEHFEDFEEDTSKAELVLWDMVDQTHDVRLDLNHALLTFCQAFFYENMKECRDAYKPSFGGSLTEILTSINAAKRDDLLNPGGGSTLARIVEIKDTNLNPECIDAHVCPINYLRKNRVLFFNLSTDNTELMDVDAYKVARINLTFVGARPTSENKYLKVGIESSGDFLGLHQDKVHHFLTRALSLTYEYNIHNGHVSIFADVYQPFRNIVQHITPYTTWVMRISDMRSADIDISHVTCVKMGLDGYGSVRSDFRRQ